MDPVGLVAAHVVFVRSGEESGRGLDAWHLVCLSLREEREGKSGGEKEVVAV